MLELYDIGVVVWLQKRNVRQQKSIDYLDRTIWNEVCSKTYCEDIRANYLYIRKYVLKSSQSK
jgi:hypothetical protein